MKVKVFIDGSSGTTGLRIVERLQKRPEIELLTISAEGRKDVNERAKVINSADLAFLCLPDAAAKEVMPLVSENVKILDTSTAHRTAPGWVYGFPELHGQRAALRTATRVAVPGCHASGFIALARPLVELGLAAGLMGRRQIRRLPVTENGKLCGMLSLGDLALKEESCIDAGDALTEISDHLSSRF